MFRLGFVFSHYAIGLHAPIVTAEGDGAAEGDSLTEAGAVITSAVRTRSLK